MIKIFLLLLFQFYIFTSDIKQKVETKKARRLKKDVESMLPFSPIKKSLYKFINKLEWRSERISKIR